MTWLPIDSAPKDGTPVLIAWEDQVRRAWWDAEHEITWVCGDECDDDYCCDDYICCQECDGGFKHIGAWTDSAVADFGNEEVEIYSPTHWMTCPEPPPKADA